MAAMQAESLEVLEKATIPPGQARAIVRAIEIEIGGAKDTLATKEDVRHEVQLLRQGMTEMRRDLEVKIEGVRSEIHSSANTLTRHLYGAIFGAMTGVLTVVLGVVYFLFAHFNSLR